ncbi:MAG: YggU family protein [Deltaproteobacteria bacterium]|nr:YggU family protein [Deltaproteobacteria bacterium]
MVFSDHPDGLLIDVRVQPKSSKNAIVGIHGEALKIKLNAPPVEGKANKALIQLLAKLLKCPKSNVKIVSGQASRNKRLLIHIHNNDDIESLKESLKKILLDQI